MKKILLDYSVESLKELSKYINNKDYEIQYNTIGDKKYAYIRQKATRQVIGSIEKLYVLKDHDGSIDLSIDFLTEYLYGFNLKTKRVIDVKNIDLAKNIINKRINSRLGNKEFIWIFDEDKTIGIVRVNGIKLYSYSGIRELDYKNINSIELDTNTYNLNKSTLSYSITKNMELTEDDLFKLYLNSKCTITHELLRKSKAITQTRDLSLHELKRYLQDKALNNNVINPAIIREEALMFLSKYDNIMFKGGNVLYSIAREQGINIHRETIDLDTSIETIPKSQKKHLMLEFKEYLSSKYRSMYVIEESDKTIRRDDSLIVSFKDIDTNEEVFLIDFIDEPKSCNTTTINIDNITVKVSDLNKTYADKLEVISSSRIFIRFKDYIDMYTLSKITNFTFDYSIISEYLKYCRPLGEFYELLNLEDKLREEIYKIDRVYFEEGLNEGLILEIRERVLSFIAPFLWCASSDFYGTVWDPSKGVWVEEVLL